MSLAHVAARTGKARAVSRRLAALPGVQVMWAGPDQHYVKAAGLTDGALVAELKRKLGADASVTDQSHGRVILLVEGPKARALLAKGTAVDLHPQQFPVGMSAMTQMAHVGVHLTRVGADAFELSVFRGFAESFWNWLAEQALEFGYQVN
jgi:sarcosine oxidase subunit gamma